MTPAEYLATAQALLAWVESQPGDGEEPPPAPTIESFTASAAEVTVGETYSLAWATRDATTVTLNGMNQTGAGATFTASAAGTVLHELVAIGADGATQRVTISVNVKPPIVIPPTGAKFKIAAQFFPAIAPFTGPGPNGKHGRFANVPETGELFELGGDYAGRIAPDSARQELWACDPRTPNRWKLVYHYIGPTGDVQPLGPDEFPIVYDTKRKLIWGVPGGQPFFAGLQPPAPGRTEGATAVKGLCTFDPIGTRKWKLVRESPYQFANAAKHFAQYIEETDEIHAFVWTGSMAVHIIDCAKALAGEPCEELVPMRCVGSDGTDRLWAEWSTKAVIGGKTIMAAISWKSNGRGGNLIEWKAAERTSRIACSGLPTPQNFTGPFVDKRYPGPDTGNHEGHNNCLVWNLTIERYEQYHMAHAQPWLNPEVVPYPSNLNDLVGFITAVSVIDSRAGTFESLDPVIDGKRLRGNVAEHVPGVGTILMMGSGSNAVPSQPVPTHCQIVNIESAL